MGIVSRYFLYLLDCLVMLSILGIQIYLFRGETPLTHNPDGWLELLLGNYVNLWLWTILLATGYWMVVDYHPALEPHRGRIVTLATAEQPDFEKRLLRSAVKAFTLFGKPFLLVFALFSKHHRLLHDYLAGTERVK